ncbi:hypothetical protein CVT24_000627 [Panaeolus cyanescens]|uniref:Uncharacterized protein n=1 Tax=Panaeolus cyanescens TaxID=181874 RepID=A0A409YT83_9AGAR|nr:hypothetical protein CVT24_000627 [Panaeolus cyanescens]
MPQVPWPSFTLVLTAERPQDIYRRPSVVQLVPAVMEPTAPAYLMKTIDHRWEPLPQNSAQEFASDEVFAYTLRNDSDSPTCVGHGDDDDARTVLEETRPRIRRGFSLGHKLSSRSLKLSISRNWNKPSLSVFIQKLSAFDARQIRHRVF